MNKEKEDNKNEEHRFFYIVTPHLYGGGLCAVHTVRGGEHPLVADHLPPAERPAGPLPHHRHLGAHGMTDESCKIKDINCRKPNFTCQGHSLTSLSTPPTILLLLLASPHLQSPEVAFPPPVPPGGGHEGINHCAAEKGGEEANRESGSRMSCQVGEALRTEDWKRLSYNLHYTCHTGL